MEGRSGTFHRSEWRLGYRPGLDGLRGVAILLVLAGHAALPGFPEGGLVGTSLFFVLSGFLITSLLLDEARDSGRISVRRFYWRRGLRLLPAFLTLVVVVSVYTVLAGRSGEALRNGAFAISYAANWPLSQGAYIGPLSHSWSLAIEEQFYLAWPLLLVGALRLRLSMRWIAALLLVAATSSAVVAVLLVGAGEPTARLAFGSDTRAQALLIGCLLAVAVSAGWWRRFSRFAVAGAIVALVLATIGFSGGQLIPIALPMIAAASAILVGAALGLAGRGSALTSPPLVGIGRISYGLYLWHYPIMWELGGALSEMPLLLRAPLLLALSFAAALISYRVIEAPFLRLKGRRSTTRGTAPVATPAVARLAH